jgi:cytochrome c6
MTGTGIATVVSTGTLNAMSIGIATVMTAGIGIAASTVTGKTTMTGIGNAMMTASAIAGDGNMKDKINVRQGKTTMSRSFAAIMMALMALVLISQSFAEEAAKESTGEALFQKNCASCHPNGGNIFNARKTLSKKDLEANNITTAGDIVKKIRNPGPAPTHPQTWSGMKKYDEKVLPDDDALKIGEYILKTFQ